MTKTEEELREELKKIEVILKFLEAKEHKSQRKKSKEDKELDFKIKKAKLRLLERENAKLDTMDPEDRRDYLKETMNFKSKEFEYFEKPCKVCEERPARFWLLDGYPVRLCKRCRSLIEDPDKFRKFLNSQGIDGETIYHPEGFVSHHFKRRKRKMNEEELEKREKKKGD